MLLFHTLPLLQRLQGLLGALGLWGEVLHVRTFVFCLITLPARPQLSHICVPFLCLSLVSAALTTQAGIFLLTFCSLGMQVCAWCLDSSSKGHYGSICSTCLSPSLLIPVLLETPTCICSDLRVSQVIICPHPWELVSVVLNYSMSFLFSVLYF